LPVLTIDLQDGYDDDAVVILVDGEEKYRNSSLKTDYAIGLTVSIQIRLPEGTVKLTINIPTHKLHADKRLDVDADIFVGVNIVNGAISFRVSKERFEYF